MDVDGTGHWGTLGDSMMTGKTMRILVSGGPGSGCTTTAVALGAALGLPVFDSDVFFHKPTDPPFQEQYSAEERRDLLLSALAGKGAWILSGSVAAWELPGLGATHGVFLQVPREERLRRLEGRQRGQFGQRIDAGGDMAGEHRSFMEWSRGYEAGAGKGRNLVTDLAFVEERCERFVIIAEVLPLGEVVSRVLGFLDESV